MITLAKHIELLLLDNDCVVVPDFGGFIAHYQSAYYDEKSDTFFPPQRIIGFNPKLTMNDGLLVQSYMQYMQTDFSDANRIIENEVDKIKEHLYLNGTVVLPNIGSLSCDINGNFTFIPSDKHFATPTFYGLSSFHFAHYSPVNKSHNSANSTPVERKIEQIETVSSKRNSSIGYSIIGSAVGVAVAFFLFFFLSVPVENSYVDNGNYAYLGDAGLFSSIKSESFASTVITLPAKEKPQCTKSTQTTNKEKKVQTKKATANSNKSNEKLDLKPVLSKPRAVKVEQVPLPKENKVAQKQYHVIVSSVPSEKEAQRVVEQYHKNGYTNASVVSGSGRYRISLCSYNDQSSAYNKISQLKSNKTFMDAWVLSSK